MKPPLFVLSLVLVLAAPTAHASAAPPPRLQGTFIQLTRANADWDEARWEQLFGRFRDMGLSEVVVQWSAFDDLAFYSSATLPSTPRAPIATILGLADRMGIVVFLGLAHDSSYWSQIQRDPALVGVYLRRLQLRAQKVASELAPEARKHPSFAGWYLPQEIDDVNWSTARARELLVHHVRHLRETLHALSPAASFAVSGFSNGRMDPEGLASLWKDLATKGGVDRLMFQDGVGAGKLAIDDLEPYYAALQQALQGPCQFQIVVETFTQVAGAPLDDQMFAARPAPLERIQRQL